MTRPNSERPAPVGRLGWWGDLVLGVRLAVGGGRTSWARLVLGTIGIGLATAVLLVAASVQHVIGQQTAREDASIPILSGHQSSTVDPLRVDRFGDTEYRGAFIQGMWVSATGPNSPVPPGLSRLPGPGEVVVSPALATLLDSPGGALLRPRLPAHVIGEISQAGLVGPQDLEYIAGFSPDQAGDQTTVENVVSFGDRAQPARQNLSVLALLLVGVVALLIPILIMVTVSSRIAGAARDRRLAALRLVGAGSRQVRRIAAAESLVPAMTGLALGAALFLLFRQVAPTVQVFGVSVFTSDIVVPVAFVVFVVLLVPVLTVGSALFAMRRTVIEPLGVVRGGKPVRRHVWWRLALAALGVALLLSASGTNSSTASWAVLVVGGATALLVGVPAMLPYLLERSVAALRGGRPAWQLAVRRLQLDSGTAARVVSGVAVVLAGTIAVQTALTATAVRLHLPAGPTAADNGFNYVVTDRDVQSQVDAAIARSGVSRGMSDMTVVDGSTGPSVEDSLPNLVGVTSCAAIERVMGTTGCKDGDVYAAPDHTGVGPNSTVHIVTTGQNTNRLTMYGTWRLPARVRRVGSADADKWPGYVEFLATPGALAGVTLPPDPQTYTLVWTNPNDPDAIEGLRNAAAVQPLRAEVFDIGLHAQYIGDQKTFVAVRTGLLIGALFTLTLAGISMLVLALEQVRERRRPLAMLSAAGVPRSVLGWSLLWQVAVPVVVGVVAAVITGVLLAWLVLRLTSIGMTLDWVTIGTFSGVAIVLVLLVTAATLPALRNATRLSALRTE